MKRAGIFILAAFVLFVPTALFAASGLVDQNSAYDAKPASYNLCALLSVVQNVINFAVTLSVFVATVMFAYGGILYLTGAAGGEAQIKKAHKVLLNSVIGILIVLLAWLLVNIVVSVFTGNSVSTYTQSLCSVPAGVVPSYTAPAVTTSTVAGGANVTGKNGLNISAATAYADRHAASGPTGQCGQYVRQALAAGGLTDLNTNHPQYAYQYGSYLTNLGFTPVAAGTASTGCVTVFQPVTGHSAGHVELYDGTHWVSDWVQSGFYPSQDYVTYNGQYATYCP